MHFSLIDSILEHSQDRVVAVKHVSSAEEYLQDHFPGFPVLPGVMMLEAMVQAARLLDGPASRLVLGRVGALKYGSFVQPGDSLLVLATLTGRHADGSIDARVEARKIAPGGTFDNPDAPRAASGKVTLRPLRVGCSNGPSAIPESDRA